MGLSSREVLLVLRARDEASRTIGRVSAAMSRMDRRAVMTAQEGIRSRQQQLVAMRRNSHDVEYMYRQQTLAARESWMAQRNNAESLRNQYLAMGKGEKAATEYRKAMSNASREYEGAMFAAQKMRVEQNESIRQAKQLTEDQIRRESARIDQIYQEREALRDRGHMLMANGAAAVSAGASMAYFSAIGLKGYTDNIHAAIEYAQAVQLTHTQIDQAGISVKKLGDLGKEVGRTIPIAFDEIQPALYDIFSSIDTGYKGASKMIKQFSRDAVGGQTDLQTATRANLLIMNAYSVATKDAADVSDFMFRLVQKGVGTYDEFAKVIGRSIPSAVRAGQSYQTLGGMIAFLTRQGLSAAMASTSAARALDAISNPKTVDNLEKLGINVKNMKGEFIPLPRILDQMNDKFKDMTSPERAKALYELFKSSGGTIQARRFFDAYFNNADKFNKITREMGDNAGIARKKFEEMASTPQAKLQELTNRWQLLRIEIGEHLIPVAIKVINWVDKMIDKWDNLSPTVKKNITYIVGIGLALGVVVGILVAVAGGVMILVGAFEALAGNGKIVMLIVGLLAQALYSLITDTDGTVSVFKNSFIPAFQGVYNIVKGVIDLFNNLPGPIKQIAIEVGIAALVWPRFSAGVTAATDAITLNIAKLQQLRAEMTYTETRAGMVSGALSKLGGIAKTAAGIGGIMALASGFGEASKEGVTFGGVLKGALGGALTGFAAGGGPIGALIGAVAGGGLTALTGAFSDAGDAAKQTRGELLRSEGFERARDAADKLTEALAGVVHEYGEVARATIEQSFMGDDGKLDADVQMLRDLGVSMDTIVSATMGQKNALNIVQSAFASYGSTVKANFRTAFSAWMEAKDGVIQYRDQYGKLQQEILDDESMDKYKKRYEDAKAALEEFGAAEDVFGKRVNENTGAIEAHQKTVARLAKQLGITVKEYQKWPQEVRTRFESEGLVQTSRDAVHLIGKYKDLQSFKNIKAVISAPHVDLTMGQILKLNRQYKLTPDQVRTLVKQEGVPVTIKSMAKLQKTYKMTDDEIETVIKLLGADISLDDIHKVQKAMDDTSRKRVNPPPITVNPEPANRALELVDRHIASTGKSHADPKVIMQGVNTVMAQLSQVVARILDVNGTRADTYVYTHHIDTYEKRKTGGTPRPIVDPNDPRGRMTIGDAKKQAKKISETLKRLRRIVQNEFIQDLAEHIPQMAGILNIARDEVDKKLDQMAKHLKGDALKAFNKNRAKMKKGLLADVVDATEKDLKRLQNVTKRYQEVMKRLQKARDNLRNLRSEQQAFISSIKDDLHSFASFSGLEKPQDVFGNEEDWTTENISSQLQAKLAQIKQFGQNLKTLLKMGFSKQVYRQVIEMGIVNGAAFAAALIQATPDEVSNINSLVSDISTSSNSIAQAAGSQLYDAGIKAAQGLIDGLKDKAEELRKIAEHLGNLIAKAIKDALKIKSPSRVGKGIASNFVSSIASQMYKERKQLTQASNALADAMSFDPSATYSGTSPSYYRPPVVGATPGSADGRPLVQQNIDITTQEIDPRKHAAQLGWELAARYGV